jgi:hypothetical protein
MGHLLNLVKVKYGIRITLEGKESILQAVRQKNN